MLITWPSIIFTLFKITFANKDIDVSGSIVEEAFDYVYKSEIQIIFNAIIDFLLEIINNNGNYRNGNKLKNSKKLLSLCVFCLRIFIYL